jgi:predicted metal-dependent hydrolase
VTALASAYLAGYPEALHEQVQALIDAGRLGEWLGRRHPEAHAVRTDAALYAYAQELKARFMRTAPPLAKVAYVPRLDVVQQALGTHTAISRVQGARLKAKREIRIAALFREAPADLLQMIVVHELAHLKEPAHDRAFYALCCHMVPEYHQLEFDARVWLLHRALAPRSAPPTGTPADDLSTGDA